MMQTKERIQSFIKAAKLPEARQLCVESCTENQTDADIWNLSAMVHGQYGQYGAAEAYALKAIQLDPKHADAYFNLGVAKFSLLKYQDAEKCLRHAILLNPQNPNAYHVLGIIYGRFSLLEEEAKCYRSALSIIPDSVNILYALGKSLNTQARQDEAIACYDKALAIAPGHVQSALGKCISRIPVIYRDEEHVTNSRRLYQRDLQALVDGISLNTNMEIVEAAKAVGDQPNFYLAYQGMNDLDLQLLYGGLIENIQSHMYPQWSRRLSMPETGSQNRIRIGVVSRFFYNHSNWKMPIKGWLANIDKERFELYGYYTGLNNDAYTDEARSIFDHFFEGNVNVEPLCNAIRNDNLHVLIYPEIGMDQITLKLASLRLAPIQCSSWGHPETSGLSTIDYFLSSELMEPENGQANYSEKLIKLANLSIFYEPLEIDPTPANRENYGLKDDMIVYFCAQSLFKYLPEYDHVFPDIACRVIDCQFVFIQDSNSENVNNQFTSRLRTAFSDKGLDFEKYVVLTPRMDSPQYKQLNLLSDIFLDSIGWSGCNSSMEAIECDLPVVALAGELMRNRHSHAFLSMMGIYGTTASSIDDYIDIAVMLAEDAAHRKDVSKSIAMNKHKLYRDTKCIMELEEFIEEAVKQY